MPSCETFLTGLTVGSSYTYHVVAVDTKGSTSQPSQPVTFTVPPLVSTGGGSGCTVPYTLTSSRPDGFGAGVTIRSGQNVSVANPSWNSTIVASGGNVGIGFNGATTGPATAPTAFAVNGSTCSTN